MKLLLRKLSQQEIRSSFNSEISPVAVFLFFFFFFFFFFFLFVFFFFVCLFRSRYTLRALED